LDYLCKVGVSRSSTEIKPKDTGVLQYYFPETRIQKSRRSNMINNITQNLNNLPNNKKNKNQRSKLQNVLDFESLVDEFIDVIQSLKNSLSFSELYKENTYRHSEDQFEKEFLTFESVQIIVNKIQVLWEGIMKYEKYLSERAPYYLNYFFRGLIIHISTWFLYKQTSQKTQEHINLIINRIYHRGNKFGGKEPNTEYQTVEGETVKGTRTFETMLSTYNRFSMIQQLKLEDFQ